VAAGTSLYMVMHAARCLDSSDWHDSGFGVPRQCSLLLHQESTHLVISLDSLVIITVWVSLCWWGLIVRNGGRRQTAQPPSQEPSATQKQCALVALWNASAGWSGSPWDLSEPCKVGHPWPTHVQEGLTLKLGPGASSNAYYRFCLDHLT
jgi:hypothetical protein